MVAAAAQAVMDEAIAQFAPYTEAACPLSSTPASAAGAEDEIMSLLYTHVDPNTLVGGLVGTEWGSNGIALGHIPITDSVGCRNGHVVQRV